MSTSRVLLTVLLTAALGACSTYDPNEHAACKRMTDAAGNDLDRAKTKGLGDVGDVVRAAALLAAANTQRQFNKYASCVEKAAHARELLKPLL